MNNKLLELSMNNFADEDGDILHIPHGDMPGDKINIEKSHIEKAKVIFPELIKKVKECATTNSKVVITVCGGSGVGKSEIASLLAHYLRIWELDVIHYPGTIIRTEFLYIMMQNV